MTQLPVFVIIFLIGLPVALAIGPRRYPALCCALAFQTGLAVAVFAALLLLVVGIPCNALTLGPLLVAVVAGVLALRPLRPDARTVRLAVLWTVGFTACAAVLSYWNLSIMSFDSHHIVMLGKVVDGDETLSSRALAELMSWGVFQIIAQSFFGYTEQDYLYSLQPVFGLSFLPVFAIALWHATGRLGAGGRLRTAAIVVTTLALFTVYAWAIHLFFIHTNLGTAVYLFGFLVLFWLAEQDGDAASLPLIFLFLLCVALQRLETPVVALIAVIATCMRTELPRRTITWLLGAFTVIVSSWYTLLAFHLKPKNPFLTPRRSVIIAVIVAAFFAWWLASAWPRLRAINRHLHVLVGAGLVIGLGLAFATKPEHMWTSVDSWATNLATLPHWGYAWYGLAVALIAALFIPAPPSARVFTVTVWVSLAYWLVLSYAREPYRNAFLDSANRMTIHILPLCFFYLGLKAIPGVTRRDAAE